MGSYRKLACAIVKSILKVKICAETWRNSFEESEGEEKSASLIGPLADGPERKGAENVDFARVSIIRLKSETLKGLFDHSQT